MGKHGSVKSKATPKVTASAGRAVARTTRRARWQLSLYLGALLAVGVGLPALFVAVARTPRAVARSLDARGLRVSGAGRADATRVLPAALFSDARVQNAYRLAAQIPVTLNQLYCWCGCIERGMRSNLECFETTHASVCEICLAGAEVAWALKQQGVTDPARVQQVLDARYAPRST